MIERAWQWMGWRALPVLVWAGCATAHDVDALSPELRGEDASVGMGTAGGSGRGTAGSSGQGGSSAGGRGGNGGSSMASGGSGGSSGGRGGGTSGRGGGGNLPCSPCSGAMGSMGGMLSACCTQDNQCGVDIGSIVGQDSLCARQNAPGTESMDCPSYTFQGNFQLTSCCGADGLCGVFIRQTAPLGCVDPALLGDLVTRDSGGNMGGGFFGGQNMGGNQGGRQRCNM
jgi:hypothetical protein